MTAASMTASGIGTIPARYNRGLSLAASDLSNRWRDLFVQLREPLSLGEGYRDAMFALGEIVAEAGSPDWDGHGALPLDPRAVEYAVRILAALPTNVPQPEIAADPDGEVSLEWYRGVDWVFSISVGADGELSYAGRYGNSRIRGIEEGTDDIPAPLLGQLDRFLTGIATR